MAASILPFCPDHPRDKSEPIFGEPTFKAQWVSGPLHPMGPRDPMAPKCP